MAGKPRREGYLLIDHMFSPGVTPEMLHAAGVGGPAVGADTKGEFPTITCCHCCAIVVLNPLRKRARGYCSKCDAYHCDNPACGLECRNFDKMLDFVQDNNAKLEDRGIPVTCLPDLSPLLSKVSISIPKSSPLGE